MISSNPIIAQRAKALKMAEQLEAQAKELRRQLGQPQTESFAEIKRKRIEARDARLSKFGAAMAGAPMKEAIQHLELNKWSKAFSNEKTQHFQYCHKDLPGMVVHIKDGKYSVTVNQVEIIPRSSLKLIQEFLKGSKSTFAAHSKRK